MCKALFGTCLPQLFSIIREQEEDLVTRNTLCCGRAGVKGRLRVRGWKMLEIA